MLLYITFNDYPSGIYTSQVTDVVKMIRNTFKIKIRLVAFISIRGFINNRKKIKQEDPSAIILPMFPKLKNWKLNKWILYAVCILYKPQIIIARGVFSANLALEVRNYKLTRKVCFDGRGAIKAEWEEYDLVGDESLKHELRFIENRSVNEPDFRIAVSQKLIEYWNLNYNYSSTAHVIIPCTLGSSFEFNELTGVSNADLRAELGFNPEDILLVYSGSSAGWQSFELLSVFLSKQFEFDPLVKVLFLTREDKHINDLKNKYPEKVKTKWVSHYEVNKYLSAGDYGLLIREQSVTNRVASPTKFAEYLACGLPVLISENLGDYTALVRDNNCGYVITESNIILRILKPSQQDRMRMAIFAKQHFYKKAESVVKNYTSLLMTLQ
jgi:hypothetical protein